MLRFLLCANQAQDEFQVNTLNQQEGEEKLKFILIRNPLYGVLPFHSVLSHSFFSSYASLWTNTPVQSSHDFAAVVFIFGEHLCRGIMRICEWHKIIKFNNFSFCSLAVFY